MKPTIAHTATHPRRRLACGKFDTNGSSMQSHPRAQPNSPALWGGGQGAGVGLGILPQRGLRMKINGRFSTTGFVGDGYIPNTDSTTCCDITCFETERGTINRNRTSSVS